MNRTEELARNLASVRARMAAACARAGRPADAVRLVAVSKFHPVSDILAVQACGQRDFGESYAQEWQAKQAELAGADILWHFIGGVQTKKAKQIAGCFVLVHSVDSEKLARELASRSKAAKTLQSVLIEVNMGEEQKSGVADADLPELARLVLSLREGEVGLDLQGLMCMAPLFNAPEDARPYFAHLRELRDGLEAELGVRLPHLSMGMTGDFEAAIEEGATIVRVGTSIFGARPGR
jgi:PLP dependent protein